MTANHTNRVSALKRLSKPIPVKNNIHDRLSASTSSIVTDARQLLTNRNKPIFDARQLLSRQSSKTLNNSSIISKDILQTEEDDDDDDQQPIVITRLKDGRLTAGTSDRSFEKNKNPFVKSNSIEPISFTKTITNTSFHHKDTDHHSQIDNIQSSLSDEKVFISFTNNQYRKRPKSPSPPPVIKRLHDASIQTNSHQQQLDDYYQSPTKRNSSRNITTNKEQQLQSTTSKSSTKRTSINTPLKQTNTDDTTILITNLQSSVTEDDIIELFGKVGHINEIITLSQGCIQIIYSKSEYAEQAVTKYHNRSLDGQLMYVSLQQSSSYSTKSSNSKSTITKDNNLSNNNNNELLKLNSNKINIDPTFIRQALFNPSNNTKNPVQFQVKL